MNCVGLQKDVHVFLEIPLKFQTKKEIEMISFSQKSEKCKKSFHK
jgi:hypothetical protein